MGAKKRRNQTRQRSPSKAPGARTTQPRPPTLENSIPSSSTAFTPVNASPPLSISVLRSLRHQPPITTPYSQAEWTPSPVNPSPPPLHPNWNSPLTKGGFGNTPLKNALNPAGGKEYRNTGSSNPPNSIWTCDANVKSLTDAYSKIGLNIQQGNELTFEISKTLLLWTKRGNTYLDEEFTGNTDFVKSAILSKGKVKDFMDEMWAKIVSTHPQTTRKYFDEFATNLWNGWVREKKKTANRLVSGTRRRVKQTQGGGSSSHRVDTIKTDSVSVKQDPTSVGQRQATPPAPATKTISSASQTFHSDIEPTILSPDAKHIPSQSHMSSVMQPLMSPASIISKSNDSQSTSSFFTPRKRSFAETELQLPLSASSAMTGNPAVEEYLLYQLTKNIREGWLTPQGVKRVLQNLETEHYPTIESDSSLQVLNGEQLMATVATFTRKSPDVDNLQQSDTNAAATMMQDIQYSDLQSPKDLESTKVDDSSPMSNIPPNTTTSPTHTDSPNEKKDSQRRPVPVPTSAPPTTKIANPSKPKPFPPTTTSSSSTTSARSLHSKHSLPGDPETVESDIDKANPEEDYPVEEEEEELLSNNGDAEQDEDVPVSNAEPESSLEQYVKTMQIEKEILDLTGDSEINENLLDPNAIPPERSDLWLPDNEVDPDCQIIEDARPDIPRPTPPLEEDGEVDHDDPFAQPTNMEALLISPITPCQFKNALGRGNESEHKGLQKVIAELPEFHLKPGIKLKSFQKLGVSFLLKCREKYKFGLLGDEMGVGKTIQALTCIHAINLQDQAPFSSTSQSTPVSRRSFHVIFAPVALVSNWTQQASTFYDQQNLSVKVWSESAWNNGNFHEGTVWIIKESLMVQKYIPVRRQSLLFPERNKTKFWQIFGDPNFKQRFHLLSTFADEGHLAWRSDTSTRSEVYKRITANSDFNVILSGTMFPLGPEEDARGILEHLAGGLSDDETAPGKWPDNLRKAFRRLLSVGQPRGTPEQWDVLAFRILISQFYLRRTISSSLDNQWVIDKTTARPVPRIVLPHPDAFTQVHDPKARSKQVQEMCETLRNKMKRADHKRFLAWSGVYEMIQDIYGNEAVIGAKYVKKMEKMVEDNVMKLRPSGRITKLIALLKAHHDNGEKFVIVSDRLFLIVLSYFICSEVLGYKVGVLAGTTIFDNPPTEGARDAAIDYLNHGDLDGIVMTDRVGGCGHNLTGANVMIFVGSLYSHPYEEQAIARICRPGQTRLPKIYIIADPSYEGDRMAFEIKDARKAEGDLMKVPFDKRKGHYKSLEMVEALLSDEETWSQWKTDKKEAENKERERLMRIKAVSIAAKKASLAANKSSS